MNYIEVPQRKLSLGEILENERRAKQHAHKSNTKTISTKIADGWYVLKQIKL